MKCAFISKLSKRRLSEALAYLMLFLMLTSTNFVLAGQKPAEIKLDNRDDGSQTESKFRVNYAGYLPLQAKVAVFLSPQTDPITWSIKNGADKVVAQGSSKDYRLNDFASGDSFFLIDFSSFELPGESYTLHVGNYKSAEFAITNDPYKGLKFEVFDYFKDHRRSGDIFDRAVNNWTTHTLSFKFIADAGDQGYYTVNAAEAQWSLINLLESYPDINLYYQKHVPTMAKVYDELVYINSPMEHVIFPGEKLAVAKFATYSNDSWALCNGASGTKGACISLPETKATFSVARTLAAMSRLHQKYGTVEDKDKHYNLAKTALFNAENEPFVCLTWESFGGEGGYYPNNDNYSIFRDPRRHRKPCAAGKIADPKDNNISDDQYAAQVELYLAAAQFDYSEDMLLLKQKVISHPHHNRVDKFFFGAVSTQATLSLLTHKPAGINLTTAKSNLFTYANKVLHYQEVGYPGVTFDAQSTEWQATDNNEKDANFRWGSNRMQLNDARILMAAANIKSEQGDVQEAAKYTNGVLKVLDQISGTNAVALAMYTSGNYDFIEKAVTRTHDALVADTEAGKMVLGPNNWTNADDLDMPEFSSLPGMKMFAMTGTGWASREISIDANAALVPVIYFATEIAPTYLAAAKK